MTPGVDAGRFGVVLADRLSRIVPDGFGVQADTDAGMLRYRHPGHLHLWYGEDDEVTLACEPIPLAELGV